MWTSPQGSLLPSGKEAPYCICLLAFWDSLAVTMGLLLPHLCFLGFVYFVFILFFFSARDGTMFRTFSKQVALRLSYVPSTFETGETPRPLSFAKKDEG